MKSSKFLSLTMLMGALFAVTPSAARIGDNLMEKKMMGPTGQQAGLASQGAPRAVRGPTISLTPAAQAVQATSIPQTQAVPAGQTMPAQGVAAFEPFVAYTPDGMEIKITSPEDEKKVERLWDEHRKKMQIERQKQQEEKMQKIAQKIGTDVQTLKTAEAEANKLGPLYYVFMQNVGKSIDNFKEKEKQHINALALALAPILESQKDALIALAGEVEKSPAIMKVLKAAESAIHKQLGLDQKLNQTSMFDQKSLKKMASDIVNEVISTLKASAQN